MTSSDLNSSSGSPNSHVSYECDEDIETNQTHYMNCFSTGRTKPRPLNSTSETNTKDWDEFTPEEKKTITKEALDKLQSIYDAGTLFFTKDAIRRAVADFDKWIQDPSGEGTTLITDLVGCVFEATNQVGGTVNSFSRRPHGNWEFFL
jgi:hypothetical protein